MESSPIPFVLFFLACRHNHTFGTHLFSRKIFELLLLCVEETPFENFFKQHWSNGFAYELCFFLQVIHGAYIEDHHVMVKRSFDQPLRIALHYDQSVLMYVSF